ncbi:glycoside hydrolase family 3 C-terminal domain-containing protein [Niveibacterium sp. SC-1]|uniref:glycoside hydrolase family 3 C-terminal domain-containing protein n=1 Tax=Niveibacterium sp. SC-1 TaxID=3135646 RepID=UPI00311E3988
MPQPALNPHKQRAAELVARMSIEEQALLLSGDGPWRTHGIERLGIPPVVVSDGPHGLRKLEDSGALMNRSVPATCFPTASALSATWNTALTRELGAALGREAQAQKVDVLLGPGVNIKRSPLGGRNFEYFSEDPLLAGSIAAAYINGVQSEGVGTSLKHFAANSQEDARMTTDSVVDARTLNEIYLPAFEQAVRESQPWTVMSAYNLVNGTYASEHRALLDGVLRGQWGFDGLVVSDWGGINDRAKGVEAGNDLEMPGSGEHNRNKLIAAVREGRLAKEALARCATEVVALALRAAEARKANAQFDADAHHALARRIGGEAVVLLKNEGDVLPLPAGKKVALIGRFARTPRFQGAGSSMVNPIRITNAYDELAALLGEQQLSYAAAYDGEGDTTDAQIEEAVRTAAAADIAVVFAGLPDSYESEGWDRRNIAMPAGHVRLIEAVAAVQSKVVVVLLNGSAVEMPWAGKVKGIVEGWLGGQAGGGALADVLSGKVNPSGKLAETFPVALKDSPAHPYFPSHTRSAVYGEGVFVGYRHFDAREITPLFPFGFGLSYTRFAYTGIRAAAQFDASGDDSFTVEVSIKNVGPRVGQEVVQLYVHEEAPALPRPPQELRAFDKVTLEPGQEKTVRLTLRRRDFAYYDAQAQAWTVKPGRFEIRVGGSSRDLPLTLPLEVTNTRKVAKRLTLHSVPRELKELAGGAALYSEVLAALGFANADAPISDSQGTPDEVAAARKAQMSLLSFVDEMPLVKVPAFSQGRMTDARLEEILLRQSQG